MPFKTFAENLEIIKNWYKKFTELSCKEKILVFCLFLICFAFIYFLGREGFINEKWENNIRRIEQSIIACFGRNNDSDTIGGEEPVSTEKGTTNESSDTVLSPTIETLAGGFTKERQPVNEEPINTTQTVSMGNDGFGKGKKNDTSDRLSTIIYGEKAILSRFTEEKAKEAALLDAENRLLNKFTETQKSIVRRYMVFSIDTVYKNSRGTYTVEARYMIDDKYLKD